MDYENFAMDLPADRAFLENADGCGEEDGLVRCLCVCWPGRETILVLPDGTGHVALRPLLNGKNGARCAPLRVAGCVAHDVRRCGRRGVGLG